MVEEFNKTAEHNSKFYDPEEEKVYVDDEDVIRDQLAKLKLTFFDEERKSLPTKKKTNKKASNKKNVDAPDNKDVDENLFENIDFTLTDSLNAAEEQKGNSETKVDLTAKMCQAFGSDLKDVTSDGFTEFEVHNEDSESDVLSIDVSVPKAPSSSSNNLPSSSIPKVPFSNSRASISTSNADSTPSLAALGEANKKNNEATESSGLDFSSGPKEFNFGLPKVPKFPSSAKQSASKDNPVDEEEIFTGKKKSDKTDTAEEDNEPFIDLNAPIIPKSTGLVTTEKETKELEDWLSSVLDD